LNVSPTALDKQSSKRIKVLLKRVSDDLFRFFEKKENLFDKQGGTCPLFYIIVKVHKKPDPLGRPIVPFVSSRLCALHVIVATLLRPLMFSERKNLVSALELIPKLEGRRVPR